MIPLDILVTNYVALLAEDGIPSPLHQRLMVCAVLADLCLLAEVSVPPSIVEALSDEVRQRVMDDIDTGTVDAPQ